ncbi:uncharacterized protein HMPREF1541_03226 [Cyphellophora europaea CBS 101466]|uniref:Uncharacterized protein n=1 Tax=Cyphellophora europaea (strain CBS 101466) TaxID=1220924 RepID=W2RXP6_CYPE1|nr:uncharacterized protein HMPREF1541_03226 [Cyphellophora europaea CBS 101466]ETN41291.1 hypothetical protein HMPREF1541_03226 [Cyphellophora europaea CBS 101466]
MCIFFLPPLCAFSQHRHARLKAEDNTAAAHRHLISMMRNPDTGVIAKCVAPTHANPFFCANPRLGVEVRHSPSKENPTGEYDACETCTALARGRQAGVFKEVAEVKKGKDGGLRWKEMQQECLCERATREGVEVKAESRPRGPVVKGNAK